MEQDETTLLFVGEGERLAPAIEERLKRRGLKVVTAPVSEAAVLALVLAPDAMVLAGTAAEDGGAEILEAMHATAATVPVILIEEREGKSRTPFRHGVVASFARTASADEMARLVAGVLDDLPEAPTEVRGVLAGDGLEDLVGLIADSLRSGILTIGREGASAQLVVRAEQPVDQTIEELTARVRALVQERGEGPVRYEFHESPTARLSALALDDPAEPQDDEVALDGRRVLLIEQNPARADVFAQHLRAAGVTTAVADGSGAGLELAGDLLPEVVLIDGRGIEGWAIDALRAIRRDPRLRWASLLVVDADRIWVDTRRPDIESLAPKIRALVAPDAELARRVEERDAVMTRLDVVGPVRMLRALGATGAGLRVRVRHPRVTVEIDLADGLVAGASARLPDAKEDVVQGVAALSTLLGLGSGRVQITHEDAPASANVMTPVDDALHAASVEEPAVPPSLPPPSLRPPRPPESDGDAMPDVVRRLETLLGALDAGRVPKVEPTPGLPPGATPPPPPKAGEQEDPEPEAPRRRALPAAATDLPEIGEEEEQEVTGAYDPKLIERLRNRMKRSEPKLAAVAEERPPEVPPPATNVPPPKPRGAQSPNPRLRGRRKKRTLVLGSAPEAAAILDVPSPEPSPGPKKTTPGRPNPIPRLSDPDAPPRPPRPLPPARSASGEVPPAPPKSALPAPKPRAATSRPRAERPSAGGADALRPGDAPSRDAKPPRPRPPAPPPDAPLAGEITRPAAAVPARMEPSGVPTPALQPPPDEGPTSPAIPLPAADIPPMPDDLPLIVRPEPRRDATPSGPQRGIDTLPAVAVVAPPDVDTVPPPTRAPKGRARAWILPLAVAVPLAIAVAGGAWYLTRGGGEDEITAARPPHVAEVRPEPEPPATDPPPHDPPATTPTPSTESERAADDEAEEDTPSALPADGPIEGIEEGFGVAALGVVPRDPPGGRRAQRALERRLLQRANRHRRRDEMDQAEELFRELLGYFPDHPRGAAGLTQIHLARAEPGLALPWAQRLVRLRPRFASNWVLLGDVYLETGDRERARQAFERALELEPTYRAARARLADL